MQLKVDRLFYLLNLEAWSALRAICCVEWALVLAGWMSRGALHRLHGQGAALRKLSLKMPAGLTGKAVGAVTVSSTVGRFENARSARTCCRCLIYTGCTLANIGIGQINSEIVTGGPACT